MKRPIIPHSPVEWVTIACLNEAFWRRQVVLILPAKASIPCVGEAIQEFRGWVLNFHLFTEDDFVILKRGYKPWIL